MLQIYTCNFIFLYVKRDIILVFCEIEKLDYSKADLVIFSI
jgi:hypothetical protein